MASERTANFETILSSSSLASFSPVPCSPASSSPGSSSPVPCSPASDRADYSRLHFLGESAGANISHKVVRASDGRLDAGVKILGMALVCPFFGDGKPETVWTYLGPENSGADDPRLCPMADLNLLSKIVCGKVLVCTAGEDRLREAGKHYHEALKNSGWCGEPKYVETEGEGHCFHLNNPTSEKAKKMKIVDSFIN